MPLAGGRGEGEGVFTLTCKLVCLSKCKKKKQKISLKSLVVKKGKKGIYALLSSTDQSIILNFQVS
jgi:hypothetical protein